MLIVFLILAYILYPLIASYQITTHVLEKVQPTASVGVCCSALFLSSAQTNVISRTISNSF